MYFIRGFGEFIEKNDVPSVERLHIRTLSVLSSSFGRTFESSVASELASSHTYTSVIPLYQGAQLISQIVAEIFLRGKWGPQWGSGSCAQAGMGGIHGELCLKYRWTLDNNYSCRGVNLNRVQKPFARSVTFALQWLCIAV